MNKNVSTPLDLVDYNQNARRLCPGPAFVTEGYAERDLKRKRRVQQGTDQGGYAAPGDLPADARSRKISVLATLIQAPPPRG